MLSVHEPLEVIGEEPVTVIWFAVPARPTDVTVPDPPPPPPPVLATHVNDCVPEKVIVSAFAPKVIP
jgi:hypothetical protein